MILETKKSHVYVKGQNDEAIYSDVGQIFLELCSNRYSSLTVNNGTFSDVHRRLLHSKELACFGTHFFLVLPTCVLPIGWYKTATGTFLSGMRFECALHLLLYSRLSHLKTGSLIPVLIFSFCFLFCLGGGGVAHKTFQELHFCRLTLRVIFLPEDARLTAIKKCRVSR